MSSSLFFSAQERAAIEQLDHAHIPQKPTELEDVPLVLQGILYRPDLNHWIVWINGVRIYSQRPQSIHGWTIVKVQPDSVIVRSKTGEEQELRPEQDPDFSDEQELRSEPDSETEEQDTPLDSDANDDGAPEDSAEYDSTLKDQSIINETDAPKNSTDSEPLDDEIPLPSSSHTGSETSHPQQSNPVLSAPNSDESPQNPSFQPRLTDATVSNVPKDRMK